MLPLLLLLVNEGNLRLMQQVELVVLICLIYVVYVRITLVLVFKTWHRHVTRIEHKDGITSVQESKVILLRIIKIFQLLRLIVLIIKNVAIFHMKHINRPLIFNILVLVLSSNSIACLKPIQKLINTESKELRPVFPWSKLPQQIVEVKQVDELAPAHHDQVLVFVA